MKTKRFCAALSAMLMACSALPVMGFNAAAKEGNFPKDNETPIRNIITDIHKVSPDKLNLDNDPRINFNDFKIMEEHINGLYVSEGISYYQKDEKGNILAYNSFPINKENEKYDINGDEVISPDDYCSFLYAISNQFKFTVSENNGVNTQLTATITGTNIDSEIEKLVIPSEIYDFATDRIYPVTEIAANAFANLKGLKEVEMSNYVQPDWLDEYDNHIATKGMITASNPLIINRGAFKGCSNLKTVVLPEYVSVCADSFAGTPFLDNNKNEKDYDVKILTGSKNAKGKSTVVAYGIRNINDGNLNIPACVTAISDNLAHYNNKLKNINFEGNENGLCNIEFIGKDAFSNCDKLDTVNHLPFNQLEKNLRNQLYKYVNAFNGTPFMAEETNRQLDKIINKITHTSGFYQMNDAEKTLVAAKYFVYSVYYNKWDTFSHEFSLYPNPLYSTVDLARECQSSEFAALNVRFTCCEGIAQGFALVLDRINVRNLTKGEPDHALNMVYIPSVGSTVGKWFTVDLSSYCGDRIDEIMSDKNRNNDLSQLKGYDESANINNCDSKVVNNMTIDNIYLKNLTVPKNANSNILNDSHKNGSSLSNRNFFQLFKSSENKHIIGDEDFSFIFNNDNSKLLLYKAGQNDSYEYVKAQAEKQAALSSYINEGIIGFIDANDSNNKVIIYDEYELEYRKYDTKDHFRYEVKNANYFDANYRFHGEDGKVVKNYYIPLNDIYMRVKPEIKKIYFIVNDKGFITFSDSKKVSRTARVVMDGNKIHCYDLNSNEPLDGEFKYGDYFWLFDKGELIDTNCIDS